VRSLQKVPMQLRFTNLCVNGTSSTPFCTDIRVVTKRFKTATIHEFWVKWSGSGAFIAKNSDATSISELVH
jgi:hypothetical protein